MKKIVKNKRPEREILVIIAYANSKSLVEPAHLHSLARSFTRPPDKSVTENYCLIFSIITYVVGTQKNRLNEKVFFKHPKHLF